MESEKKGQMKHSVYLMMSPYDIPESFYWNVPTKRDCKGNVLATVRKPAFIAKYHTTPDSKAEGWIVAVRKMSIDVPPLTPPS